ncbi:MAG TPA: hypothetical protein PLE19_02750 [Planctomycetota bacterium]|nr:hypothetical protein [Planctomycetota bacterium]HRR79975.1 hypothetical protein [Planctomycetota bacterium]
MPTRALRLLAWLAATVCAAADVPPDATHVLAVRSGWEYAPAEAPPSIDHVPSEWRSVALPHRQEAEPCGLYQASFAVPAAWAGYRVSLVLRPSGGTVWVWLNGQPLGARAPSALDVRLDAARAVRPGARNTALVAIAAPGEPERPGLEACWLEASSAVTVGRMDAYVSCLTSGGVVDVTLEAANHSRERFEGRVELAFEPDDPAANPRPVWRRGSDVRLDPGQSVSVAHAFEPQPSRLWRPDDPFLYRLTATLQTRDGQPVRQVVRRVGLRSVEAAAGRWLLNREGFRLAAIARSVRGATPLCTQPGQASALAQRLDTPRPPAGPKPAGGPALDELLDFCDGEGIVAFLDAPALAPEAPGAQETLAALASEALRHPCVWGWAVRGDFKTAPATRDRLRELTPRLPIGCPAPDLAADAAGFDFLLASFVTKAGREDDDGYGRRLDDLVRNAAGRVLLLFDRVTEAGDLGRLDASLAHRGREAERRSTVAALAFELDADEAQFALAERRLGPFALKEPRHEARMDGETFVLKSRFEVQLASPVAQRLPCYSLAGHRIAWRAAIVGGPSPSREDPRRGDTPPTIQGASGIVPLSPEQPRAVDGGAPPGRGEVEWRTDKPGDIEFVAELQSAAGRVLARHRARLSLEKKDGKAELKVQPLDGPLVGGAPPSPDTRREATPSTVRDVECVHLDALAGHFNNDGLSWRANPTEGNFDFPSRREGSSLIADLLPKKDALIEVPGHPAVTFRFPDKDDRLRNNVLCDGQRLQLAKPYEAFDAVWFLGACHDGARTALLTIDYEDGQAQGELRLADWLSKPAAGEIDVLRLPAIHTADGKEEARECGLVAWRVPLDPRRKLMAITLPRERNMHVFAATLTRTRNP